GRNANTRAESRHEGEETADHDVGRPGKYFHMRTTSWSSAGDDVDLAIVVDVARGHVDSAVEARCIRQEIPKLCSSFAAECHHCRGHPGPGAHEDVREPVAVEIAGGDRHSAVERGGKGKEATDRVQRDAVEDFHVRPTAGAGARDDIGD